MSQQNRALTAFGISIIGIALTAGVMAEFTGRIALLGVVTVLLITGFLHAVVPHVDIEEVSLQEQLADAQSSAASWQAQYNELVERLVDENVDTAWSPEAVVEYVNEKLDNLILLTYGEDLQRVTDIAAQILHLDAQGVIHLSTPDADAFNAMLAEYGPDVEATVGNEVG